MDLYQSVLSSWIGQNTGAIVTFPAFCLNLLLALVLSTMVGRLYIRYGRSISNRRRFAASFVLLCVVTTLIISVVSSSLALSLGLVGALSIVRFRAAIKEPEELVYLFLVIAFGVGLGGNRPLLTVTGFLLSAIVIRTQALYRRDAPGLHKVLSLAAPPLPARKVQEITDILAQRCTQVKLRRFDEHEEGTEAIFLVELEHFAAFLECKGALQERIPEIKISLFEPALLSED